MRQLATLTLSPAVAISINKRFTGRTNPHFNMRHDWNSLLGSKEMPSNMRCLDAMTQLVRAVLWRQVKPMTKRSKDRFPHADVLARYLRGLYMTLGLAIWMGMCNNHVATCGSRPSGRHPLGTMHHISRMAFPARFREGPKRAHFISGASGCIY